MAEERESTRTDREGAAYRSSAESRAQLVAQLQAMGIVRSEALAMALQAVPREAFVPAIASSEGVARVYLDEPIIIKRDERGMPLSSSSAPSMMAIMLEQLAVQPGMRVLEIGTGTGYNTAILAELAGPTGKITTIDIDPELAEKARAHLAAAGYHWVQVLCADGTNGYPAAAPYDRIVVTAAAPDIEPAWIEQLAEGGRLVLPLELYRYQRSQLSLALEKHRGVLTGYGATQASFIPLRSEPYGDRSPQTSLMVLGIMHQREHVSIQLSGNPVEMADPAQQRYLLRLLTQEPRLYDLNLGAAARDFIRYLEVRYGGTELISAYSGHAAWGFEGWAFGIYVAEARRRQEAAGGLALLRPAAAAPDDTALQKALVYGHEKALRRLVDLAREWQQLHWPSLEHLYIRVYPRSAHLVPAAHEWLVVRPSVQLLLTFRR
jgi:protein-L-isoaspartate(D-aspartate) O-methyltransferase